jgi:predicted secreted protein
MKANHATIHLAKGSIVRLKLAENPTTGYRWQMVVGPGLALTKSKYPPPSSSAAVGAGGTHVWLIKAPKAGRRTVTGVYHQVGQAKSAADFSLTTVVKWSSGGSS